MKMSFVTFCRMLSVVPLKSGILYGNVALMILLGVVTSGVRHDHKSLVIGLIFAVSCGRKFLHARTGWSFTGYSTGGDDGGAARFVDVEENPVVVVVV